MHMGKLRPREGKGFTQSHTESHRVTQPGLQTSSPGSRLFPPPCNGQAGIGGGSSGLPHILEVEGIKNIHGFVLSCVMLVRENDLFTPVDHEMVWYLPHARWSVHVC